MHSGIVWTRGGERSFLSKRVKSIERAGIGGHRAGIGRYSEGWRVERSGFARVQERWVRKPGKGGDFLFLAKQTYALAYGGLQG
jgi:hypothetical protein